MWLRGLAPPSARRRAAGLSQRVLAARAGLDFTYISKVENGRLPPPAADTIVALSRVLDSPPEDLLALTRKIPSVVHRTVSANSCASRRSWRSRTTNGPSWSSYYVGCAPSTEGDGDPARCLIP